MKPIPTHNTQNDTTAKRIEECREHNFDGTHRHNFYEILLFSRVPGGGTHSIDFEETPIRTDSIYILKPGQAYSMALTSHKGFLITVKPEYLHSTGLLFETRLEYSTPSILNLGAEDLHNIKAVVTFLHQEHTGPKRRELITAHIHTLLSYLGLFIREHHKAAGINSRMRHLLELIEQHYITQHRTAFYATKLSLGKKRLNVLAVQAFGMTVKQLLGHRLLLQAKRMISTSHSTFKEIASELGFKDPSYFSRFFRQQEGITPEAFRLSLSPGA